MKEAYRLTRKDGAPGIDGVTAAVDATNLDANLLDLLDRIKSGRYKAPPVRRTYIPKADGSLRPLGIPSFEDKVAQRAIVMVLEAVYEQDFLPCSFGFRPGRSAHQALQSLHTAIMSQGLRWVVDIDIVKILRFDFTLPSPRLSLRLTDADDVAFRPLLDVASVERDELGPAQRGREAGIANRFSLPHTLILASMRVARRLEDARDVVALAWSSAGGRSVKGHASVVHPRLDQAARHHHDIPHHGEMPTIGPDVVVVRERAVAGEGRALAGDRGEEAARQGEAVIGAPPANPHHVAGQHHDVEGRDQDRLRQ
jgi:hypothetical protein